MSTESSRKQIVRDIVRSYDDPIVRFYSTIRFLILRQRFLDEIGQYMPRSGLVMDVGCGFGLFSLYFASLYPELRIHGVDLNARRIEMARNAARKLGLDNVRYDVGDARDFACSEPIDGAYMLDLIHHIPPHAVRPLFGEIAKKLAPDCRLIVKDIEPSPFYKLAFTWLLDKVMDFRAPVRYWAPSEICPLLESLDFEVYKHSMLDYLPYPHVIYVAAKCRATRTTHPTYGRASSVHN